MKSLMNTNIYDVSDTIIIVGSCLKNMQPEGFEELKKISDAIYEVCLEETHLNMVTTKIIGMVRTKKIKHIVFASVNNSPHCVQLHYIQDELYKCGLAKDIFIQNFVIENNKLIEINDNIISLSKDLIKLSKINSIIKSEISKRERTMHRNKK